MDNILERIKNNFSDSIQTKIMTADTIISEIGYASQKIVQCLLEGHKIMSCGNGGSACDALHFSGQMLNRYKYERPSLPAISLTADLAALTAISNDYNYTDIFAKQIRALGHTGDILLALSTSGNSMNLVHAIKAAQDRQINVIALTGHDGGKIAGLLGENDVEVRVPAADTARIQETHLLIIHCICDIVDNQLFGHGEVGT
jgi:DnaA initiator-associating protein